MKFFEKSSKTIITEYLDQCILKEEDDWGLIVSACDAVNASENGAKEAARFIKKKISKQQPTYVQERILTVFKAMADNCGAKFHAEIASRKFLDELELVAISSQTDFIVKQKIVVILGELTEMFDHEPSLWPISDLYRRLTAGFAPNPRQSTFANSQQPSNPTRNTPAKASLEKVVEDVELAKNNTQLFTQMISFTDPEIEDITKNELIQEFRGKCESLRQTIMQYISEMQDEQWLNTLISTNQDIVNAFKMYDEMVERGQITMAKKKSKEPPTFDYGHEDSDNFAGVGGSGTSQLDPFSDTNEIKPDSTAPPRRSERSRGKMPASIYHDETLFEEDESELNDQSQYPPNLTEYSQPNNNHNNTNGRQEHAVI